MSELITYVGKCGSGKTLTLKKDYTERTDAREERSCRHFREI